MPPILMKTKLFFDGEKYKTLAVQDLAPVLDNTERMRNAVGNNRGRELRPLAEIPYVLLLKWRVDWKMKEGWDYFDPKVPQELKDKKLREKIREHSKLLLREGGI